MGGLAVHAAGGGNPGEDQRADIALAADAAVRHKWNPHARAFVHAPAWHTAAADDATRRVKFYDPPWGQLRRSRRHRECPLLSAVPVAKMSAPGTVGAARRGLIDATPLRAAAHDPFPQYHEIAAEARMSVPPWPPGSYAEAHAEERAKIEAEHAEKRAKFEAEYAEARAKFEAERTATENEPAAAMLDITDLDDEDLACAGLRRAFKDDFFSDLDKQAKEEAWERYAALFKPSKPRKATLASVAKQATKAAIAVARYEVKPDGTVVVVTGNPEPAAAGNAWPLDEFRTKETKQ